MQLMFWNIKQLNSVWGERGLAGLPDEVAFEQGL